MKQPGWLCVVSFDGPGHGALAHQQRAAYASYVGSQKSCRPQTVPPQSRLEKCWEEAVFCIFVSPDLN